MSVWRAALPASKERTTAKQGFKMVLCILVFKGALISNSNLGLLPQELFR